MAHISSGEVAENKDVSEDRAPWVRGFRVAVGLVALLAIVLMSSTTISTVNSATEASAIQIIQLWSEGLFYLLAITGSAVSLYIFTRFRQ